MLLDLVIVGGAGALGAVARYLSYVCGRVFFPGQFPWVTLVINVAGCLLIGSVMTLVERAVPYHRHVFLAGAVGFLGSFTTFSTFGFENLELIQAGRPAWAALNIGGQVALGIAAVWLGRAMTHGLVGGP